MSEDTDKFNIRLYETTTMIVFFEMCNIIEWY